MGLETPFKLDDMGYGLYVARIEGLKMYAPAKGLPEIDFLDQNAPTWFERLNEKFSSSPQIVSGCCNMGLDWPAGRVVATDILPFMASWLRYVIATVSFLLFLNCQTMDDSKQI